MFAFFFPGCQLCMYVFFKNMSSRILNKSDACIFFKPFCLHGFFPCFFPTLPITFLMVHPLAPVNQADKVDDSLDLAIGPLLSWFWQVLVNFGLAFVKYHITCICHPPDRP